jgi:hypothetical protein
VASVIDESHYGSDHSSVSAESLDDGGYHGLIGGRVQTSHLAGRESNQISNIVKRKQKRLTTLLLSHLLPENIFKLGTNYEHLNIRFYIDFIIEILQNKR